MELGKGSSIHYLYSCFSSIEVEDQPFLSLATIEGNSNNETMKIKYPLSKKNLNTWRHFVTPQKYPRIFIIKIIIYSGYN